MASSKETGNPSEEQKVRLSSCDGVIFEVKKEVALKLKTIAGWLEEAKDLGEVIPVPEVEASILDKVIRYCEHHVAEDEENDDSMMNSRVTRRMDPFDDNLMDADQATIFGLI